MSSSDVTDINNNNKISQKNASETSSNGEKSKEMDKLSPPVIRKITTEDVIDALDQGIRDFRAAPIFGLFFGAVYAIGGLFLFYLFNVLAINSYVYPMAVGFAMIAPFAAAGLYAVSHKLEKSEPLKWGEILNVTRTAGGKDLVWMVLVTTFAYIIWLDIAAVIYILFYGFKFITVTELLDAAISTPRGFLFLLMGNVIGFILSLIVFSITVVSLPLLYHRHYDFVTAMITSVKAVQKNPKPMLLWMFIIGVLLLISLATIFIGLLVSLPVLGHGTWHLYRKTIEVPDVD